MYVIPVRENEALKYLEEKYHETFTLQASTTISLDQPYGELFYYSESFPFAPIKVYDDRRSFRDNYFGILVRDQIQGMLDRATGGRGRIFFRYTATAFPDDFRDPSALPELMENHPDCFMLNMFLFTSEKEVLDEPVFQEICDRIRAENITGMMMGYVAEAEQIALLSEENYAEILSGPEALSASQSTMIR